MKKCCICDKSFEGWGNDPWGAAWIDENGEVIEPEFNSDDYCCDECNNKFVIPGRMLRAMFEKKEAK